MLYPLSEQLLARSVLMMFLFLQSYQTNTKQVQREEKLRGGGQNRNFQVLTEPFVVNHFNRFGATVYIPESPFCLKFQFLFLRNLLLFITYMPYSRD